MDNKERLKVWGVYRINTEGWEINPHTGRRLYFSSFQEVIDWMDECVLDRVNIPKAFYIVRKPKTIKPATEQLSNSRSMLLHDTLNSLNQVISNLILLHGDIESSTLVHLKNCRNNISTILGINGK